MRSERKYPAINLMELYQNGTPEEWNAWLTRCLKYQDVYELQKAYYRLQAGMDDVAKTKVNIPGLNEWYLRLLRSVERTVKSIYKQKFPCHNDDPLRVAKPGEFIELKKEAEMKRNRDRAFEVWLRAAMY